MNKHTQDKTIKIEDVPMMYNTPIDIEPMNKHTQDKKLQPIPQRRDMLKWTMFLILAIIVVVNLILKIIQLT